jgi:hypothetical protein
MNKILLSIGLVVGLIYASSGTTSFAQNSSTSPQQTKIPETIKPSVIQAIGAEAGTVEIASTPSIMTIKRVNSNMNGSTHEGRSSEAKEIALKVVEGIKGRLDLNEIIIIRVEYSKNNKIVDTVEFRKGPDGVFDFHQS